LDSLPNDMTKNIAKKVVEQSLRFTMNDILDGMQKCMDRVNALLPRYNLYIPQNKIGSEHWILLKLRDRLHPIQVIWGYKNVGVINQYPIIILDDFIYSSINMCTHIDSLKYEYMLNTGLNLSSSFYCVVFGASSLIETPVTNHFKATIIAAVTFETLTIKRMFPEYIGKEFDALLYKIFGLESEWVIPVYAEHKIANCVGCWPFFKLITKYPPNRSEIDLIQKSEVLHLIEDFQK
jgi:hypothetical protein